MTALNDNFDSLRADFNEKTLVLPVKNFVNDAYCSDISKKVMEYKKSQGEKFSTGFVIRVKAKWSAVAVKRILTNELYMGMMVQRKNEKVSHKVKHSVEKPKEEWVRVPDIKKYNLFPEKCLLFQMGCCPLTI